MVTNPGSLSYGGVWHGQPGQVRLGAGVAHMSEISDVTQQAIDYSQRIPNNVDLSNDRSLQRALEHWQPAFLSWWNETGPANTGALQIYLRTAVSVDRDGWASFGYV